MFTELFAANRPTVRAIAHAARSGRTAAGDDGPICDVDLVATWISK
jgi:hypothetical protein